MIDILIFTFRRPNVNTFLIKNVALNVLMKKFNYLSSIL